VRMANRLEARFASPVGRLLRGPLLALLAVAAAAAVLLRANSAVLLVVYLGLSVRLSAVGLTTVIRVAQTWGRDNGVATPGGNGASAVAFGLRNGWRRPDAGETVTLVQAFVMLALAECLLWLVWTKPGPWISALLIVFAAAQARPLARRLHALPLIRRRWRRLPAVARATVPTLVLLNVAVAIALGNVGIGLFAVLVCLDFGLLNRLIVVSPTLGRAVQGAATDASRANGYTNGYHPDAANRLEDLVPCTAGKAAAPEARAPSLGAGSRLRPRVAAVAVVASAGWIAYARPGPLVTLGVLALALAIPFTSEVNRDQAVAMVLGVAVAVATIDYVSWRFGVMNWGGWWIAAPLLCAETLGAIHVLGFQFTLWPRPPPRIEPAGDPTRYPIFIFVPTVNEGEEILRPTLEACIAARDRYLARHPRGEVTIVVCNDGRAAKFPGYEEIDGLAKELGIECVTRPVGGGAKAGNIENARQQLLATGDSLILIFDADQVPKPDFLLKTIPPFADPRVGWVQTGQYYANLNNPVARWADDQQSMFYNLLCSGKAALNAAFICGTNVVIRATALDEIGGLPQDSVTEDFAASIALHPRWRSIYLTDVLATGLGPLDIPSYLKQQRRWALGTLGVFRSHWREILLPTRHGLRAGQRVQYLLACTHYLCGPRDVIYVASPILFLVTGVPAVRTAALSQYLAHFLPYAVLGVTALWYPARKVTGLRGIIIGFGSFPAVSGSLASVILGRKAGFAVTSKARSSSGPTLRYLRVYVVLVLLCIAALVWATQVHGERKTSLFISLLWIGYSLVMLGGFLSLAWQDIRFQARAAQAGAIDEVSAKLPYPSKLLHRPADLQPMWNLGLAVLMATPFLVGSRLNSLVAFPSTNPAPLVVSRNTPGAPFLGVSLPVQLVEKRPVVLERDLDARLSIVGRTQDIHDHFDRAWAEQLAAHGGRPWITLQFGVFGPGRKVPLDANLPAIFNGVDDGPITRWAREVRAFRWPVYLTILEHTDKDWSLSSAVANGGIPEDVPRAWAHVQSIFRRVGATNVAWVWAPADPIDDRAFAPPPSTIDAVLQSFINFPGTRWGQPRTELQRLERRYPGKPLFVEASASGPPEVKARWLARLGGALKQSPQVYALLYHEGGPALEPTSAEVKSWSLASDPRSLGAMKHVVAELDAMRRHE
jgi:cellulose synthase/poly-beta-1,6-N-acetylglucosamine synthase-like glycosyltransferase